MDIAAETGASLPWRERAFLPLPIASQVIGLSTATLYNMESAGKIEFRRVGGRTLVTTESLIRLVENAERQAPRVERTAKARAARSSCARASWGGRP